VNQRDLIPLEAVQCGFLKAILRHVASIGRLGGMQVDYSERRYDEDADLDHASTTECVARAYVMAALPNLTIAYVSALTLAIAGGNFEGSLDDVLVLLSMLVLWSFAPAVGGNICVDVLRSLRKAIPVALIGALVGSGLAAATSLYLLGPLGPYADYVEALIDAGTIFALGVLGIVMGIVLGHRKRLSSDGVDFVTSSGSRIDVEKPGGFWLGAAIIVAMWAFALVLSTRAYRIFPVQAVFALGLFVLPFGAGLALALLCIDTTDMAVALLVGAVIFQLLFSPFPGGSLITLYFVPWTLIGLAVGRVVVRQRDSVWLASRAFSRAIHMYQTGDLEPALRWFEYAMEVCRVGLDSERGGRAAKLRAIAGRSEYAVASLASDSKIDTDFLGVERISFEPERVVVKRGCELVGGSFEYKVKVLNESGFVVTDVIVNIVSYPEEVLQLASERTRAVGRIENGGFRSLQFVFEPTNDCVQGSVFATVSFTDPMGKVHSLEVRPYTIRSVCDLLKPIRVSTDRLLQMLEKMQNSSYEEILLVSPHAGFRRMLSVLEHRNFAILEKREREDGGQYHGEIKALAQGKYTDKYVAVIVAVTGDTEAQECLVAMNTYGDDSAMIPITTNEVIRTVRVVLCPHCAAPLSLEDAMLLHLGVMVRCEHCGAEVSPAGGV